MWIYQVSLEEQVRGNLPFMRDAANIIRNEIEAIKRKELHCVLTPVDRHSKIFGWGYSQRIIRVLFRHYNEYDEFSCAEQQSLIQSNCT